MGLTYFPNGVAADDSNKLETTGLTISAITGTTVTGTTVAATTLTIGGTAVTATAAELNRNADTSGRLVAAGGTLSATEALHDSKIICLDTAAGSVVTLPTATGSGARFTFIVTVTPTSNAHIIKTARTADHMQGFVLAADDTGTPAPLVWVAAATDDTITMNSGTTGGEIGDRIEVVDVVANVWAVKGILKQSGTEATPFSATVS